MGREAGCGACLTNAAVEPQMASKNTSFEDVVSRGNRDSTTLPRCPTGHPTRIGLSCPSWVVGKSLVTGLKVLAIWG